MRILVVEDEHRIAQAIKQGLEQESFAVDVAYDGEDGLNTATNEAYDVVLLDVMLPGLDGYEVCRRLRAAGKHMPVMMLTAKDQPRDIVQGLNTGADDYLSKPFSFEVLLARVNALLRRPEQALGTTLHAGDLTLDTSSKAVRRAGQNLNLSTKEYALLEYLLRNKNQVLSKNNIMSHVWDFDADILPNTVEVFMTYLRAKVDKPFSGPNLLVTMRGFGYKLQEP